jgi:hypothetical protein
LERVLARVAEPEAQIGARSSAVVAVSRRSAIATEDSFTRVSRGLWGGAGQAGGQLSPTPIELMMVQKLSLLTCQPAAVWMTWARVDAGAL